MIQMNNSGLMTIDRFNKLTGHETLHPLICMVDLSKANLTEDIRMMCNFYGLLYYNDSEQEKASEKEWLRLVYPGETVEIPSNRHRHTGCYSGCCFIPICYATHRLKTVSRPTRNAAAVRVHCRSTKGES